MTDLFTPTRSCRCEQCRPQDPDPLYSRAHLLNCEANYVAKLPSDARRTGYLNGVRTVRGDAEYRRLRTAAWNAMNEAEATA